VVKYAHLVLIPGSWFLTLFSNEFFHADLQSVTNTRLIIIPDRLYKLKTCVSLRPA